MRSLLFVLFSVLYLFSPLPIFGNNNADPVNSSISVSTTSVPADGKTAATISVTVKDSNKNPLANDHITITSSADSGIVIGGEDVGVNHHTAATDNNGNVNFTVSSRNISPGTVTFTISDVSDLPNITLGTVRVTFTPSSLAPNTSCGDSPPTSAPLLQSALPSGANQITLTWTEANDPVSYYLVAFGTKSKDYVYGNPNVGGKGTTTYTVDGLARGTTYYFVVRAGNGCAAGAYSNELSAVAGRAPERPTSTPQRIHSPTPTQTHTPTPTGTPIPLAPSLVSNFSNTNNVPYIFMFLFGFGSIAMGLILYRKKKKL